MLSDAELIDRLQSELAPLRPRADLAEQLREQRQTSSRLPSRLRSPRKRTRFRLRVGTVVLVASGLMAVAVGVAIVVLGDHQARPQRQRLAARPAKPKAGPVTCRGRICHQGHHVVRNPSGSSCGQHSTWVAIRSAPQLTYGCARRSEAAY
jgi:hypothetical protein